METKEITLREWASENNYKYDGAYAAFRRGEIPNVFRKGRTLWVEVPLHKPEPTIEFFTFRQMIDIWRHHHPEETVFYPIDPLQFEGSKDLSILKHYHAHFFGLKVNGVITAATTVHPTTSDMMRIRETFIYNDDDEEKSIGKLLATAKELAQKTGQRFLWDVSPDDGRLLRHGFTKTKQTRSGEWFIIKSLF